jgi:hypothetical protein
VSFIPPIPPNSKAFGSFEGVPYFCYPYEEPQPSFDEIAQGRTWKHSEVGLNSPNKNLIHIIAAVARCEWTDIAKVLREDAYLKWNASAYGTNEHKYPEADVAAFNTALGRVHDAEKYAEDWKLWSEQK